MVASRVRECVEKLLAWAARRSPRRELVLLVCGLGLVFVLAVCDLVDGASPRLAIWAAAAVVVFTAAALYVTQILTEIVSDQDVEHALERVPPAERDSRRAAVTRSLHERSVNGVVRLAYMFTAMAAAITILPFVLLPRMPAIEAVLAQGAVGVLRGCRAAGDHTPPELDCSKGALQWLVNIGGVVTGRASDRLPDRDHRVPARDARAVTPSESVEKLRAELETWNERRDGLAGQAHDLEDERRTLLDHALAARGTSESDEERLAIHRLESALTARSIPTIARTAERYEVQGGLVVPLYFEVVALMGAVVSMTRRVPEFQRRAGREYFEGFGALPADQRAKLEPPLTSDDARDNLVFQIMQVLCAPLIGCVAYSFVGPELPGSAVVLAFAAGFSSESILLRVRKITNWLEGKGTEPMPPGAPTTPPQPKPDASTAKSEPPQSPEPVNPQP